MGSSWALLNFLNNMATITHTVSLLYLNSADTIVETLNSLPNTKCIITSKTSTSVVLSIDIPDNITLDTVLTLGTLIGSIQTSLL